MITVVKAGRWNKYFADFKKSNYVAIDFGANYVGKSKEEMKLLLKQINPKASDGQINIRAGQIDKFINKIEIDEYIITYNSDDREYWIGKVVTKAIYEAHWFESWRIQRKVERIGCVSRDELPVEIRNSLGAIMTVFQLPEEYEKVILAAVGGQKISQETIIDKLSYFSEIKQDITEQSFEFIKDTISALDPYQFQDLVAGLLRALGYKTKVSSPWPDGGKDIVATKDWFGFEEPTIFVEVKHRKDKMGRPEIQKLLGAMKIWYKALFVSSGGYKKEAYEFAEKTNHHIVLVNLNELTSLIIDNYDNFDVEAQRVLSLTKIYRPIK